MTAPGSWPGHVGVTIFFFLSGYLITTLLRREYESAGRISLSKFYLRRAIRILPPAYLAIGAGVLLGAIGVLSATTTGWGVLAEALNYTNYYLVVAGPDGLPPETSMLWSLAVEEHFYLLFPALLIVLFARRLTRRRVGVILLIACGLAVAWRTVLFLSDASFYRLYTSTDTRFDSLLIGAAMALMFNPALGDDAPWKISDRVIRRVFVPIAVVAFGLAAVIPLQAFRLTVADTVQYLALIPIFWFVIREPGGWAGKVLNNRFVVRIGVLSFSIYLFHRMIIACFDQIWSSAPAVDAVSLIATILVAQLVYSLVERPLGMTRRKLEARIPTRRTVRDISN
ncbi:peptidoglycan/LPS O-acetylase OafA/YrhL [Plantibacter flavus]